MSKIFGSILIAALVLSIAAVAIPVKAPAVGTLELSAPYFYGNATLQVKLFDPDLIGVENVTIAFSVEDGPTGPLKLRSPLKNGEFYGYFANASTWTAMSPAGNLTSVLEKPPYGVPAGFFSDSYVNVTITPGKRVTFTYTDSSPVGTVTASAIYKEFDAELVAFDRTEYPMFGYMRITIREWDQNLDPTRADTFTATFNFYNVTHPTGPAVDTETINGTETGPSTGVFRFDIPYSTNTKIWTPTTTYANLTTITSGSLVRVDYSCDGDTVSRWVELRSFPVSLIVDASFTTYGDLVIRLSDPNLNLRSWIKEEIDDYFVNTFINVSMGNDFVILDNEMVETDVNTGVFEYRVPVVIGTNNTDDTILQVAVGQTKATIKYYFNSTTALKAETVSTLSTTAASITSERDMYKADAKVRLIVNAPDLNDDIINVNFFQFNIPGNNDTIDKVQAFMGGQNIANLTIRVNGLLARGASPQNLIFIETGVNTGVFTATLDLAKIYNNVNERLKNGDLVEVVYDDLINKVTSTTRFTIGVAAASISMDRTTYPLPYNGPVRVHITVNDTEANISPTTIDSKTAYLDVFNYTGGLVKSNSLTLTETGPNTGIFTGSITLNATTVVKVDDPALIGGSIKALCVDPATGKNISVTAGFVATDASISVDKVSVKAGDVLRITVTDPDMNLDSRARDTVTVGVKIDTVTASLTLTETDVNTGVFTTTVTIGSGIYEVKPGKTIEFSYDDRTPSYITAATDYPAPVKRTATAKFATHTGSLSIDKKEYGLGSRMIVTLTDPDLNTNITSVESIDVVLRVPGYPDTLIKLVEENVSSPVFRNDTYTWSATDTALIGKTFQIIYRDDYDAEGKVSFVVVTGTIRSWDADIKFDKAYYSIGDMVTITVTDPDANRYPDRIETIDVQIMSTTDMIGQSVICTETGVNTGVFVGRIQIVSTYETGKLYVKIGDTITAQYRDALPADYAVTGRAKTFTGTAIVGVPIERPVPASDAKFLDPTTGVERVTARVGETTMLQATVRNVDVVSRPFTAIFKVKDPAGVTIFISWITGTIAPGQSLSPAVSWTPTVPGTYTIEVLVIKSIAEPTPYSDIITRTLTITR